MKNKKILLVVLAPVALSLLLLGCCSKDSLTGPENQAADLTINQGIPADQINWISWKPEVKEQIDALAKSGLAGKMITQSGGTVGGNITFGNTVEIPAGAVPSNTYITVEVLCADENEQCGAEVEFLPTDMQFLLDVKIALSWEYLDFEGNPQDLNVYWLDESTGLWVEVYDPVIDLENKTISVYVDHFTRYGWGF